MAFSDPQSVTIGGTATSMPRTASGVNSGQFTTADGTTDLKISHAYGKRTRRTIRLDTSKIAADPFTAGQNNQVSMSAYLVIDVPKQGYSLTEQTNLAAALATYLTAATNAKLIQLLGGEN
jgi:hypothetical protein